MDSSHLSSKLVSKSFSMASKRASASGPSAQNVRVEPFFTHMMISDVRLLPSTFVNPSETVRVAEKRWAVSTSKRTGRSWDPISVVMRKSLLHRSFIAFTFLLPMLA